MIHTRSLDMASLAVAPCSATVMALDRSELALDEVVGGRFRIKRTLGRGGMGVVYLAADDRLERDVALKVVPTLDADDADRRGERLEREARALARLSHPNVVPVFEVGEHDGALFVAMEYVQGQTLRDWGEKPRSWRVVVDAFVQAGKGLAAAHEAGLLHRDFKPDNVMLGADGRVRVLDFGLARTLAPSQPPESKDGSSAERPRASGSGSLEATLTDDRVTVGTPAYMAPEQFLGNDVDERTDVFAFCVSLYEVLYRERPFRGGTRMALVNAVVEGKRPKPPGDAGVPRWLERTVLDGLAVEQRDRPQSMRALVDALERGLLRGRRRLLAAVGGLGLITAAVAGWGLSTAAQTASVETCDEFVAAVDRVWGPEQSDALGSDEVPGAVRYAKTRLDALVDEWRGAAAQTCTEDRAPDPTDATRRCLEGWLGTLGRSVELVSRGDVRTLVRAPDLLARIDPPEGDFCALGPSPVVDPDVWTLAESAREAAVIGDHPQAMELAQQAVARAEGLDDRELTPHLAEAHAARAEALARGGDFPGASEAFAVAERHAIGGQHPRVLLSMRLLWAKIEGLLGRPDAAGHLARAEPLAFALEEGDAASYRGELAEAYGVVERARGDHKAAIARHREAKEAFDGLGQPLLSARALLGVGASHQLLGELDEAEQAYEAAAEIFDEAGVPAAYRNRVKAELNLGLLAVERLDLEGLKHLEYAQNHGSEQERIEALTHAMTLTVNARAPEQAKSLAERALAALEAGQGVSPLWAQRCRLHIGFAFGLAGDPRAEGMLEAAQRESKSLPLIEQITTLQTLTAYEAERGGCEAVDAHLDELDRLIEGSGQDIPTYIAWRRTQPPAKCRKETE